MNIEKVKSYTSSNIVDKFNNPLIAKDLVLSCGNIGIFISPCVDGKRVLVGYKNGQISQVNPKSLTRIESIKQSLEATFDSLKSGGEAFNSFTKKRFFVHVYKLRDFVEKYKRRSLRLFKKHLYEETLDTELFVRECDYQRTAYMLHGKYYWNKYSKIEISGLSTWCEIDRTKSYGEEYHFELYDFEYKSLDYKKATFEQKKPIYDLIYEEVKRHAEFGGN